MVALSCMDWQGLGMSWQGVGRSGNELAVFWKGLARSGKVRQCAGKICHGLAMSGNDLGSAGKV